MMHTTAELILEPQRLEDFFLARQPILDRTQSLAAYELLFRSAATGPAMVGNDLSATAAVILNTSELGVDRVVGGALGFINVDAALLMSDIVNFLPADRVVLEILETVRVTPELLQRIVDLAAAGYTFALDDVVSETPDVLALMPLVGIIKVDIMHLAVADLLRLSTKFKGQNKRILAEKVETLAQFQHCIELGFDYFQGYYFAKPTVLSGKKLSPSQLTVLELMGMLVADADTAVIERCIKKNASLSLALLRMANTPAVSFIRRIDSLSQALAILGRQQLQRWLQILLYAEPSYGGQNASPLLSLATTRGRLLELIAGTVCPGNRTVCDVAFTVGIMSLMDALFDAPMHTILEKISVRDDVREALLARTGLHGELLQIVECTERLQDGDTMLATLMNKWQLSIEDLTRLQLEAFQWSDGVVRSAS
jgi:EAL and modified HD-GYP domain-containing signal transduction protein